MGWGQSVWPCVDSAGGGGGGGLPEPSGAGLAAQWAGRRAQWAGAAGQWRGRRAQWAGGGRPSGGRRSPGVLFSRVKYVTDVGGARRTCPAVGTRTGRTRSPWTARASPLVTSILAAPPASPGPEAREGPGAQAPLCSGSALCPGRPEHWRFRVGCGQRVPWSLSASHLPGSLSGLSAAEIGERQGGVAGGAGGGPGGGGGSLRSRSSLALGPASAWRSTSIGRSTTACATRATTARFKLLWSLRAESGCRSSADVG